MGIVLPDGDLTNSTLAYVRDYIKNRARILAVVNLPNETFIPHGAGVKASVLFLQKLNQTELAKLKKQSYDVFFGIVEKIGYEGDKNGTVLYKRDEDGKIIYDKNKEPIIDEDITDLVGIWSRHIENDLKSKTGNEPTYSLVPFRYIIDRIDAGYYRPKFLDMDNKFNKIKSPLIELDELISGIKYGTSEKVKYTDTGIPFLRVTDINQFNTIETSLGKFVSEKTSERLKEYQVMQDDILISRTGTIGVAVYINAELENSVFGSYFIKITVDKSKAVPLYIAQFLNSKLGRLQSERLKSGGIQTNLTIDAIKSIKVPLPTKNEQLKIIKDIEKSYQEVNKAIKNYQETFDNFDKSVNSY